MSKNQSGQIKQDEIQPTEKINNKNNRKLTTTTAGSNFKADINNNYAKIMYYIQNINNILKIQNNDKKIMKFTDPNKPNIKPNEIAELKHYINVLNPRNLDGKCIIQDKEFCEGHDMIVADIDSLVKGYLVAEYVTIDNKKYTPNKVLGLTEEWIEKFYLLPSRAICDDYFNQKEDEKIFVRNFPEDTAISKIMYYFKAVDIVTGLSASEKKFKRLTDYDKCDLNEEECSDFMMFLERLKPEELRKVLVRDNTVCGGNCCYFEKLTKDDEFVVHNMNCRSSRRLLYSDLWMKTYFYDPVNKIYSTGSDFKQVLWLNSIPSNNYCARLMYYIKAVDITLNYSKQEPALQRFTQYRKYMLTDDEKKGLHEYCNILQPSHLNGKCIVNDDSACSISGCKFISVKNLPQDYITDDKVVCSGKTCSIESVLIYKKEWIKFFYEEPFSKMLDAATEFDSPVKNQQAIADWESHPPTKKDYYYYLMYYLRGIDLITHISVEHPDMKKYTNYKDGKLEKNEMLILKQYCDVLNPNSLTEKCLFLHGKNDNYCGKGGCKVFNGLKLGKKLYDSQCKIMNSIVEISHVLVYDIKWMEKYYDIPYKRLLSENTVTPVVVKGKNGKKERPIEFLPSTKSKVFCFPLGLTAHEVNKFVY